MGYRPRYEHTGKKKNSFYPKVAQITVVGRIEVSNGSESVVRILMGRKASHCFTPNVSQRDST